MLFTLLSVTECELKREEARSDMLLQTETDSGWLDESSIIAELVNERLKIYQEYANDVKECRTQSMNESDSTGRQGLSVFVM